MVDKNSKEYKSKSQLKREMLALQEMGKKLVELGDFHLKNIPMSEELRDTVLKARSLKREALRRQLQRIGALMREEDANAIRQALDVLFQPSRESVAAMHEIEEWRNVMIEGDDAEFNELVERFPHTHRQRLCQLRRNARKERQRNKPPKSARLLFRYLNELRSESSS